MPVITPRARSYTFGEDNTDNSMSTYTSFLNEMQRFVLNNPEALQLYRHYLLQSTRPKLANHIDFYQDLISIEKSKKQFNKFEQGDKTPLSYFSIFNKYFSGRNSQHLLDIKQEIIMEVRDNFNRGSASTAFKSAIYAVLKDLCFENLTNFTNSDMFQDCKGFLPVSGNTSEMLNLPIKERNTTVRLRKFFGEQLQSKDAGKLSFRSQPRHVKTYRLNKRFGERVMIEHNEGDNSGGESPRSPRGVEWRRSRRLHVFFGDSFLVDDILFSEKIRAPGTTEDSDIRIECDMPKQPEHVNSHRLARFFGERVHVDTEEKDAEVADIQKQDPDVGDEIPDVASSRFAKNHRIYRFFGERIDTEKESSYKMFADQPANVKSLKLKKIFGSPDVAAAVDPEPSAFEDTDPMKKVKRAHKLHKFFGTKVDEDGIMNMEEDHVVPSV